ncbi:MAG: type III secretion system needle filament subunit SctF [Oligoflexales bacterium]|nr:type III secretion system needle filament subunit SctF [Oligoflexales bacterium]
MSSEVSGTSSVNLDLITQKLGEKTVAAEKKLNDFANQLDPNSPTDMIKFQKYMQEWTIAADLQSSTIKSLRDVLRNVIDKM